MKSCGCYNPSKFVKSSLITHGLSKTRLYRIYHKMKGRCCSPTNDNYKYYGARGISICKEWLNSFKSFYEWANANGYKPTLTLERIDVNGNYCPDNCTWIPQSEQLRNTRRSVKIDRNGETKCLKEWCEILGVDYQRASVRYRRTGDFEYAIKPTLQWNKKPIICVETNEVFESVNFAARKIGCFPSQLVNVLKGKRKTVKGFHYKYLNVKKAIW